MNKFLYLCLSALFAAIAVIAVGAGVNSCSEGGLGQFIKGPVATSEPTDIELSVENVINPVLTSSVDAIAYQDVLNHKAKEDSVFRSMGQDTISKVMSVLLKKNGGATVCDIVEAYLANREIYDNVTTDQTIAKNAHPSTPNNSISLVQEGTTTVTEAQPTRVGSSAQKSTATTTSKDTTIDGKRAKITTTVEKYE